MSGTGLEVHPDMTPEEVLAHYGVPGMQWGKSKANRLSRLERVADGSASVGDKLKTGSFDVALGSPKSQIGAQIRAAKQLESASAAGEGVTKAALKYYGTRTVPQVAALTFNRAPKATKSEMDAISKPPATKDAFSAGKQERLDRLTRVQDGTASKMDALKTGAFDIALGSAKSQVSAQIRAAQSLKTAQESGKGTTKALLNYYGTRSVPQIAALTFNRKPKSK